MGESPWAEVPGSRGSLALVGLFLINFPQELDGRTGADLCRGGPLVRLACRRERGPGDVLAANRDEHSFVWPSRR